MKQNIKKTITAIMAVIVLQISFSGFLTIGMAEESLKPETDRVVLDRVYSKLENPLESWKKPSDTYAVLSRSEDGAIIITGTGIPTGSNFAHTTADFDFVLDDNEVTRLESSQVTGKYAIEIDMETNLTSQRVKDGTTTPNPAYIDFRIGSRENPKASSAALASYIAQFRVLSDINTVDGEDNLLRCMIEGKNYGDKTVKRGQRFKIRLEVDSADKTFDCYYDDVLVTQKNYKKGQFPFNSGSNGKLNMFNSISIGLMPVLSEGSYVKIYGVKVINRKADSSADGGTVEANEKYNLLPESLCADNKNVTEDITIPNTEGVAWSSNMPEIVSTDGKVNRWIDDIPVNLTGSFTTTNSAKETLKFNKVYKLNVKAQEGVERTVVLENIKPVDWEFSDDSAEHSFEENTLTLTHKGDTGGYSAIGLLNAEIPENRGTYEAIYNANHSGIYDLEFDVASVITGEYPASVEAGYLNPETGIFTGIGKLNFNSDGAAVVAGTKSQILKSSSENYKIKLRFDTTNKKIWAYCDDELKTPISGIASVNDNCDTVNAVRILLDPAMNTDDTLSIGNVKLTRRIDNPNSSTDALISAADSIKISDITDTPDDISNGIKTLPQQVGGAKVIWSSDSGSLDLDTGNVYKNDTQQDVSLTAKIISGDRMVSKVFYLKIPAASGAEELVSTATKLLEWSSVSNQPEEDIRHDINLPSEWKYGTQIKWSSSNPQIIGNDGVINKQTVINTDTPVTLTATISKNAVTLTKKFDIIIKRRGLGTVILPSLEGGKYTVTPDGNTSITCDATIDLTAETDGLIYIKDSEGNTALILQIDGDNISCNGNKPVQIAGEKKVSVYLMPDKNRVSVWVNGTLIADCIPSREQFNDVFSVSGTGTVKDVKADIDDYGIIELNMAKYQYLDALKNGYITDNLKLSKESVLGANVKWSFDDSAILDNGTVTADDKHHQVNAVFTISKGSAEYQESVKVIVPPLQRYNLAIGKKSETGMITNSLNPLQNAFDGDSDTYFTASASPSMEASVTVALNNTEYVNTLYLNEAVPAIGGYVIEISNGDGKWTEIKSGNITDVTSNLIRFDTVNPKYLKMKFVNIARNSVAISEIGLYLEADNQKRAEIDINAVQLDTAKQITGNIDLPNTGKYGTSIIWKSSQPSVISDKGIYSAPEYDTKVVLTAYSTAGDKKFEKSFEMYVKGTKGAQGGKVISGGGSGGGGSVSNSVVLPPQPNYSNDKPTVSSTINPTPKPIESNLFSDVTPMHWAYEYIKQLKSAGIVDGVGGGYFEPDSAVTREQFLKMILAANGTEISEDKSFSEFSDVLFGEWYFDYVVTAKEKGIISGISDTLFGIGQNIKRQDMAVMIFRTLNDENAQNSNEIFADNDDISGYAADAIYKLKALGVIRGDDDNMFRPHKNLTRAEAAAVISSLYDIANK